MGRFIARQSGSHVEQSREELSRAGRSRELELNRTSVGCDGDVERQETTALPLDVDDPGDSRQYVLSGFEPNPVAIWKLEPCFGTTSKAEQVFAACFERLRTEGTGDGEIGHTR